MHREFYETINLLWTHCDNSLFKEFIETSLDNKCNIFDFDQTYFGFADIDIVICNNRSYLNQCTEAAKYFHSPVIVIDHYNKQEQLKNNKAINVIPITYIAVSKQISLSWDNKHDIILSCSLGDNESKKMWSETIRKIQKQIFSINTELIK